jgi:archaellum component FlaC
MIDKVKSFIKSMLSLNDDIKKYREMLLIIDTKYDELEKKFNNLQHDYIKLKSENELLLKLVNDLFKNERDIKR